MGDGDGKSRPIPVLIAVLVCDVAVTDPSTGKKNLIGIFDRLNVEKFPTRRYVYVYFRLADAEGEYKIELKFVHVNSGKVLAKAEGKLISKDRLVASDGFVPFPPLEFPEPGRYEFQVWAEDVYLGNAFMDAVARKATQKGA